MPAPSYQDRWTAVDRYSPTGCSSSSRASKALAAEGHEPFDFDLIAAEPRLRATAIQTVGEKGYDGFAQAVVG